MKRGSIHVTEKDITKQTSKKTGKKMTWRRQCR